VTPRLCISQAQAGGIRSHLLESARGTEEVAFVFATWDALKGGRFRAVDWYAVPPGGFLFCSAWHFELSDETRGLVIKRAHDLGVSLIEVHSHIDPEPPAFSPSDLYGFEEFVPHVWWRLRGRPYAAFVMSAGGLDGLAWIGEPGIAERMAGIEVAGRLHPASLRSSLKWAPDTGRFSHE